MAFNKRSLWKLIFTVSVFVLTMQAALAESSAKKTFKTSSTIKNLNEFEHFTNQNNTASLLSQNTPASNSLVEVEGIRIESGKDGIEVILETKQGNELQPVSKSEGNNFIVEIPNARLVLATGNEFRRERPIAGITEIFAVNTDTDGIRLTIAGEVAIPKVELFDDNTGLIFTVTPVTNITQAPPTPENQKPEEPQAENQEPIELVVTGEQDSYRVPNATTATRTDTPLRDTPQSIQVIPREVLKDQQVTRLTDALRNVSGVVQTGGFGGTTDQLNIRGFDAYDILSDGFQVIPGFTETANVEQIEVLKGPASILYGQISPGGIVNLVTKKPLREPYFAADLSIGSFSFYRPTIDISGPLTSDKTLLYRLNIAYENSGSFRDFVNSERFFISPVFDWKISDRTNLSINLNYTYDNRTFDRGIVAFGGGVGDIPISRFLGEPDDSSEVKTFGVGYRLEHRFSENLTLRNAFQFSSDDSLNYRAEPLGLDEATGEISRNYRSNDTYAETYSLQTDVVGKFATGSVQHTLLFGFDLSRQTSDFTRRQLLAGLTPSINVFNPIYSFLSPSALADPTTRGGFTDINTTDELGIFLQNQVAFSDNLKLLVGGRFDIIDGSNFFQSANSTSGSNSSSYNEAFSPRIGIVYQPIQPISLYASYSRSFQPNFGQRADGSLLEPERGTQYEVGIKADLNNRLSATLAAYEITKTNIATPDPNDPDFSIPIGEQRNRGIELDIAGEISPGWKIFASYGYTDAKITQSNDLPVGAAAALVPEHKASLWTTYQIQQGNLQGLGFGLGLFYVAERPSYLGDNYVLPSYFRTDAAIFYKRDNWKAAINIKNLFDVTYFDSINYGRVSVVPGVPLTVVGSFSINF